MLGFRLMLDIELAKILVHRFSFHEISYHFKGLRNNSSHPFY